MHLTITPGKILLLTAGVIIGRSMASGEAISTHFFVAFILLLIFLAVQLKAKIMQHSTANMVLASAADNKNNWRYHEGTRSIDLSEFDHEFKVTKSRMLKY